MTKHHDLRRQQYVVTKNPTLLSFRMDDRGGRDRQITGKLQGNDLIVAEKRGDNDNPEWSNNMQLVFAMQLEFAMQILMWYDAPPSEKKPMTDNMDRFYKNLEEVFSPPLLERMPHDMLRTLIKLYVVENKLPSSVLILSLEALDLENDSVQMAFADLQTRVKKLSPMKVVPTERVA